MPPKVTQTQKQKKSVLKTIFKVDMPHPAELTHGSVLRGPYGTGVKPVGQASALIPVLFLQPHSFKQNKFSLNQNRIC